MVWEENSRICLHMQLIAILSRIGVFMANKNLNRIKVMLAERNQTNKWLAEQLGKDPATVSKWVTNASQPSLEMFSKLLRCLNASTLT